MQVELTRISEKGQVVIPASLREEIGIRTSDKFLIFGEGNTLILKRIEVAGFKKSLAEITAPLQKIIQEEGFTSEDLRQVIKNARKNHQTRT